MPFHLLILLHFRCIFVVEMAETRYFTSNQEPPNVGVPPGTMFARARNPLSASPPDDPHEQNGPPNGGAPPGGLVPPSGRTMSTPPPAYFPPAIGKQLEPGYFASELISIAGYPRSGCFLAPALVAWCPLPAPSPATLSVHGLIGTTSPPSAYLQPAAAGASVSPTAPPPYEPSGQFVDGHMLKGHGWSYIAPAEHTTIHFVNNGIRPCDSPYGYHPHSFPFSKHKVSCDMTVQTLIGALGCLPGPHKGVTELILLGSDRFTTGDTFTQGGETSKRTLREVGWTGQRGKGNEVWLVVKK